jgi:hypothetical protein
MQNQETSETESERKRKRRTTRKTRQKHASQAKPKKTVSLFCQNCVFVKSKQSGIAKRKYAGRVL